MICAYVPHQARFCPAFAACFAALSAQARGLDMPHGHYSFLMIWGDSHG